MKSQMTAKRLRVVLMVAMLLVIVAVGGGFYFAHKSLLGYAKAISQLNADADTGDQSIATLRSLEEKLDSEKQTIDIAQSVVSDSSSFATTVYQDINRIASESGVSIASFEFVNSDTSTSAPATTPQVAPTSPAPAAAQSTPSTGAAPSGVSQKSVTVTLASPVSYEKLMTFISKIEANELKLQIAKVNLTKEAGGNVGTQTFSIGAYVR